LVLTDGYAAGWRADAVGPAPQKRYAVLPADHTLRAIPLSAGRHQIRLEYRPRAFTLGIAVTAAASAAYALALLLL